MKSHAFGDNIKLRLIMIFRKQYIEIISQPRYETWTNHLVLNVTPLQNGFSLKTNPSVRGFDSDGCHTGFFKKLTLIMN